MITKRFDTTHPPTWPSYGHRHSNLAPYPLSICRGLTQVGRQGAHSLAGMHGTGPVHSSQAFCKLNQERSERSDALRQQLRGGWVISSPCPSADWYLYHKVCTHRGSQLLFISSSLPSQLWYNSSPVYTSGPSISYWWAKVSSLSQLFHQSHYNTCVNSMIVSNVLEEQGDENNPSRQPSFCLQPVCAGFIFSIELLSSLRILRHGRLKQPRTAQ